MGILRGLGKVLGSTLFTTFLVLSILTMELVSFTTHDNFKSVASGILEEQVFSQVTEADLNDLKSFLLFQCSQTDKVSLPITAGQQVVLNCGDIGSASPAQLKALVTNALIDAFYYKDYTCSFLDCIKSGNIQDLLVLTSNEGNQLYKSLQIYMWIGTVVGLAIFLISTETWAGRLKGVGMNLVVTGLPFIFLGYVQNFIIGRLLSPEMQDLAKPLSENLSEPLKIKFIIVLVVGLALVVAGYALAFYLSRKSKKK